MTQPGHPAPERNSVPARLLWFGLFGAPTAWALQLISSYALVAHFCFPGDTPLATPTFPGLRVVTIMIGLVLLAVAGLALFTAFHSWRGTRPRGDDEEQQVLETGEGRARFMAQAGVLVSTLFVFAILMALMPLISVRLCTY